MSDLHDIYEAMIKSGSNKAHAADTTVMNLNLETRVEVQNMIDENLREFALHVS